MFGLTYLTGQRGSTPLLPGYTSDNVPALLLYNMKGINPFFRDFTTFIVTLDLRNARTLTGADGHIGKLSRLTWPGRLRTIWHRPALTTASHDNSRATCAAGGWGGWTHAGVETGVGEACEPAAWIPGQRTINLQI